MATKRKDGRFQSSVMITNPLTGEKERKYIYGYTEEELEAERRRVKSCTLDSFFRVATFRDWVEEWLKIKKDDDNVADTTIESYRLNLKTHVYPFISENIKLKDISTFQIREILRKIKGERTKEYTYTILNGLFKQAVFEQLLVSNPCMYIKKPKCKAKSAKIIEPEIYQKIMTEIKGTQYEYLYKFAWDTGLRRGETAAIRWCNINFDTKILSVHKSRKILKGREIEGGTKSEYGIRDIPLSDSAIKNLLEWKKQLKEILFSKGIKFDDNDYVFRSTKNFSKPIPLSTITHDFTNLKTKLNLPKEIRFHSFRHTHATILAENDLGAKKIQVRLGHASAAFTLNKYTHNSARMQDGVIDALNKATEIYNKKLTSS